MNSNFTNLIAASIVTHAIAQQSQPSPAAAATATTPGAPPAASAPTKPLSLAWTRRFALIDQAGGPGLPRISDLTRRQRSQISFNFLAYLLGPIYYVYLGLWRQALTLTALSAICITAAIALGIPPVYIAGLAPTLFGLLANVDYYKSKKLGKTA